MRVITLALAACLFGACEIPHTDIAPATQGFIVGHVTDTAASFNLYSHANGERRLALVTPEGERDFSFTVDRDLHQRTRVTLEGLEPHTEYRVLDRENEIARFRTAPTPGDRVPVRLAFGSCMDYRHETEELWIGEDKIRLENHRIWPAINQEDLDAFFLIGDRVYMPFRYEDYEGMTDEEVLDLFVDLPDGTMACIPEAAQRFATVPTYSIWDDHDFGPDNSAGDFPRKDVALEALDLLFANPESMGGPDREGCWFKVTYGAVDVFCLDNRWFRESADTVQTDAEGRTFHRTTPEIVEHDDGTFGPREEDLLDTCFGETQMQWLREGLLASTADVKLIVQGNTSLGNLHRGEGWHHFRERARFLEWLNENPVSGVIFVGGDLHVGYIGQLREGGPYPLPEIVASGLGVGIGHLFRDNDTEENPFDYLAPTSLGHHFGLVEYDPENGGSVRLRLVDVAGHLIEHTVALSDLRGDAE